METAGRKISGHGLLGGEKCRKENPFPFVKEGTARTRDMLNENFYSACVYDILMDHSLPREEKSTLNHLKAKITRPHNKQFQSIVIDKYESTLFQGENPSLSHLLQLQKRRVSRIVTSVTEEDGVTQKDTAAFCKSK